MAASSSAGQDVDPMTIEIDPEQEVTPEEPMAVAPEEAGVLNKAPHPRPYVGPPHFFANWSELAATVPEDWSDLKGTVPTYPENPTAVAPEDQVDDSPANERDDPANERDYLQDHILFSQGVLSGGLAERAEANTGRYMQFFMAPLPNTAKHFVCAPMWRLSYNDRHLDELTLLVDACGNKVCEFNRKPAHGEWVYNDPVTAGHFLDVKFNVRFGEPGNEDAANSGKWTRFQRMPGSMTWVRMEADDLAWAVILSPIEI